ncbi:MAG: hypothetical protein LBV17_03900 [Treponema sp.]|jgi:hypothetical protein|nr:hypothetical protein [Treponema sp.]
MFFNLDEAKHIKEAEILLQLIDETISFIKEKGGDAKLISPFLSRQISFENNTFLFSLDVSIPLRKIMKKPETFLQAFKETVQNHVS